jgi:hypothetical protein
MKKLLLVLAIGAFAACNNGSSGDQKPDSTANAAKDSATKMADSATKMADTSKMMKDTTSKMAMDTTKKK